MQQAVCVLVGVRSTLEASGDASIDVLDASFEQGLERLRFVALHFHVL